VSPSVKLILEVVSGTTLNMSKIFMVAGFSHLKLQKNFQIIMHA